MATRVARPLVPTPTTLSPSLRKHHHYHYDDSDSGYSDDYDDEDEQPKSSGPSSSNGIIFVLVVLLCAASVAAVYFWNENRNGGTSASTISTPKPAATTTPTTTSPTAETIAHSSSSSTRRSTNIIRSTTLSRSSASTTYQPDAKPTKTSGGDDSSTGDSVATPSSSSDSAPSSTPSTDTPSSSIVPQDLLDVLLKTHNDFRALHSTPPLEWNDTLAESSNRWVDNCVFEHSGGKLLEGGYGENLFAVSGTNSAQDSPVDGKAGVDAWNDEIKMYTYNPPTGFTHETGHVTQTLWYNTKSVGCQYNNCLGIFSKGQWGSYLVCQYYPPGNYLGQFLENVLPPKE